jgi:hypothetical protein
MIPVNNTPGEVLFWSPSYQPEPHIITRRDIPSINFRITDKDHREVQFNGEEVVLEIEFIIYDVVTLPIIHPPQEERFIAPSNFAPDYASRQFSQPIRGNSHLPSQFQNGFQAYHS